MTDRISVESDQNFIRDRVAIGSVAASFLAFFSAACCVLPMAFMVVGLGGSWLSLIGAFSTVALYLIVLSVVFIAGAWVFAIHNGVAQQIKRALVISTALTIGAFVLLIYETPINDLFISLM